MGSSLALTLLNATVKNNGEETWAPLKCGDFIVHSIYHVYKPLCGSDIGATDQRTLKLQEASLTLRKKRCIRSIFPIAQEIMNFI